MNYRFLWCKYNKKPIGYKYKKPQFECFLRNLEVLGRNKKMYICHMNWYALYTKPRNEKKVADSLNALGIEVYCPVINTVKQWSDRKKKVTLPVLPSYVFVKIEEQKRNDVFQVAGVVRYVFWLGKPAIIRPIEIEALQHSLTQEYKSITTTQLQKGDSVKIPAGPFKGYEGIIRQVSASKMQLLLDSIGVLITLDV